jgi:WS/DGAT/MGAT family acyltransferase
MPMSAMDAMFLLAESREHPTHVGGLQLFRPPEGAGPDYVSEFYRELLTHSDVSRVMRRRAYRSPTTMGQWSWEDDRDIDLDYHVRHSALPRPGRVRELLELVGRLHGTLLDRHRPLWEFHLVEGLTDGRFATYTKVHHALMDGVTVMHRLGRGLSTEPDGASRPPWAASPPRTGDGSGRGSGSPLGVAWHRLREIAAAAGELAGTPPTLARSLFSMATDSALAAPMQAPATMFNVPIGGARRFAGQAWPLERVRAVGSAADATVNDVAVAMCSGALRRYLLDQGALPDRPLVALLPVSLRGVRAESGSSGGSGSGGSGSNGKASGGNAVGAILCDLATDEADAGTRLRRVRASTRAAKAMARELNPSEMVGLAGLLFGGLALAPVPGVRDILPPPFNLVISNVPGSRSTQYWNGAQLEEMYPLSIPTDGQAVNITMVSYVDRLAFGIVGCRRTVPHLQRLLDHLDAELTALEGAVGITPGA